MTLIDVKKVFLSLIDEYAPTNKVFTEDEDADEKFKTLLCPAYQEMADKKPIQKIKNMNHNYTGEDSYSEYSLPNFKQLRKVVALDEKNRPITGDYYFLGNKKLYINNNSNATYYIEYTIEPTVITDEIEDDFELEIDQDAQMMLPYLVANDYLKTDPSANYSAFLNEFQRKMQEFDTRKKGIMVEITEGEL